MSDDHVVRHALLRADGIFRAIVLDRGDEQHNPPCAAVFGDPVNGCLVRIHSRCVYGDIFGATTCDCRAQLDRSIELIKAAGTGVVIYLDQEGRGSGLLAKARGYVLTETLGLDTYGSYRHQGLPDDSRTYEDAVALLAELNLTSIRLLTNNPAKVTALEAAHIEVKRELLLEEIPSEYALRYLIAKEEHGHDFSGTSTPAGLS